MNYQVAGVAGAGPIFNELMSFVLTDIPPEATEIEPPAGVQGTNVCALSGGFPTDDQPCDTRFEYFWNENFPQAYNAVKKNIWIDKNTGRPAFSDPDQQPEDVNTDQLELQEHVVLSDPLVEEFCLDCNWTNPETGKTDYPRMQVNMSSLHLASPPSHQ
jgi:membrane carboxypeptidase/penicillin-binding protein PbpC